MTNGLLSETRGASTWYYFYFDFYYSCTHRTEHGQNTQLLNVTGLQNGNVIPYAYNLTCHEHSGGGAVGGNGGTDNGGGSTGGGSWWDTGGGNNSGGGSGDININWGGSRPPPPGSNSGWGNGDYGTGINPDGIITVPPELNVPDDWQTPPVDNWDGGLKGEYNPDFPEYVPGPGDTGDNGSDWDLPAFDMNAGVEGEAGGFREIKPDGETGFMEIAPEITQGDGLPFVPGGESGVVALEPDITQGDGIPFSSGGQHGLIDFMNP